ncbi:MAG: hypothetical protein KAS19_03055, partial [Anaerolineales bacterium]|nr:hypothetical protein [Anaerolineales bacterium]
MLRRFSGVVLSVLLLLVAASLAEAGASSMQLGMVCPSRLQLRYPQHCSNGGVREGLTEMAVQGLSPQRPLPTESLDPSLGSVPFYY